MRQRRIYFRVHRTTNAKSSIASAQWMINASGLTKDIYSKLYFLRIKNTIKCFCLLKIVIPIFSKDCNYNHIRIDKILFCRERKLSSLRYCFILKFQTIPKIQSLKKNCVQKGTSFKKNMYYIGVFGKNAFFLFLFFFLGNILVIFCCTCLAFESCAIKS